MLKMIALRVITGLIAAIGALQTGLTWGDVRLPTLIGDGMVLQRDAAVRVWGWADPGEKVRIDFHGATSTVKADKKGQWWTSLGPFTAGGPYEMKVRGNNEIRLGDIMIGDVWLASGQSNMAWAIMSNTERVNNAEMEVAGARFPNIRLLAVSRVSSLEPKSDATSNGWHVVIPETVASFSAVAYFFGRELHQRYNVPIGLIEADWGGTPAEAWTSEATLVRFPEFKSIIGSLNDKAKGQYEAYARQRRYWSEKNGKHDRDRPGSYQTGTDLRDTPTIDPAIATLFRSETPPTTLFNSMINPLTLYRIRGVIWYQGEANADDISRAAQYRRLFPALIEDWRTRWGYNFPFLFVQLAGFGPNKPEPSDYPWAELREAQSMALSLPDTGMATAIDIGEENDIHPKNKQDVAHRLALAAAVVAYGEDVTHSGPTYQSMQVEGDRIRIKYTSAGSGLVIKDKYGFARGFEIAAADGKFTWAHAQLDGQDIIVFNETIRQPKAVRYGWTNTPDGNLFNKEGLPALPFRTDSPTNPAKKALAAAPRTRS